MTDKKTFWTLDILYDYRGEAKRFEYINVLAGRHIKAIIDEAMDTGITVPLSADCYLVIFPSSIRDITLNRQPKLLEHVQSGLNRIVYDNTQKKV